MVGGALAAPAARAGVDIVHPAKGAAYTSPPVDYRGNASLNILVYKPRITIRIHQNDIAGPIVRWGFDGLDIDGDYNVNPSTRLLPFAPLPDGKYLQEVIQRCVLCALDPLDVFGGDDARDTGTFWIDSQVPDTTIDSATPPSPTNATSRTFTFTGTDPAPSSGFDLECQLDGGAWSTCTSPFVTPVLPEGNHGFAVRARDKAGNVDATPATASWVLDTTPPTVDLVRPVARAHHLLDEVVTAAYTCDDPLSGGVASGLASCVGPVPSGSPIDTSTLGPHLFSVVATDNAGNTFTRTVSYVVDPPRYADLVLQDHPLTYYRLGDPLGADTISDTSGHGHDGEYKNGIALRRPAAIACQRRPHPPAACDTAADPQDFGAFFPARDGYGFVNGIEAPRAAYSFDAWIEPADGADMSIVGHGGGGQLFIHDGHLALRQTQDTVQGGGPTLTPGTWWHVGASWDGHQTRLYVNGALVGSSNTANKAPSGTSTVYVGYGDQAPWFHGTLDEVAYYDSALDADAFEDRYEIGTATDHPSLGPGALDTTRPSTDPDSPVNNGLYAPGKVPAADVTCDDPDGPGDVASCTATVDGNPVANGGPLPDTLGTHTFTVTAVDLAGLTYVHTHTYRVMGFASIIGWDLPVTYFRLGDGAGSSMVDSSPNHRDGGYKNDQESGPTGIAGDGDTARRFFDAGGYGFVNGVAAPRFAATMEAWINADEGRDASIVGHGDGGELFIRGGRFAFRHMDQTVIASVGPVPGTWQQVVGVWDGVDLIIYVDGVERGRLEATRRPSSVSTFYVGYGELAPWFKGAIDEVAYYDTALTPARVYQHFLADPPPDGSGSGSGSGTGAGQGSGSGSGAGAGTGSGTVASSGAPAPLTAPATGPPATPGAAPARRGATPAAIRCRVPDLRGLRLSTARARLARAGCRTGAVARARAARSLRGRVVRQSVPAGTEAARVRWVRLIVGR